MNIAGFFSKLFVGEKGIVGQVADTVDRFFPSDTTLHKMSLEDQTAGDASQDSARKLTFVSHDSWLDIGVDAFNRMVRPVFTYWGFALLMGWVDPPQHLLTMNPIVLNILWTIITFWFGSRIIVKDIPNVLKWMRKK